MQISRFTSSKQIQDHKSAEKYIHILYSIFYDVPIVGCIIILYYSLIKNPVLCALSFLVFNTQRKFVTYRLWQSSKTVFYG